MRFCIAILLIGSFFVASCRQGRNYSLVHSTLIDSVLGSDDIPYRIVRSNSDFEQLPEAVRTEIASLAATDFDEKFIVLYEGVQVVSVSGLGNDMIVVRVSRRRVEGTGVGVIQGDSSSHIKFAFASHP